LHGSQPDALILCHDAARSHIDGYPDYAIAPLTYCIDSYLEAGRLTNAKLRFAGVSLNCSGIDASARAAAMARVRQETGLVVADPMDGGAGVLVDALLVGAR
jgi:uncharacterized NAD-dependent epimerase/dehydratase family protein